MNNSRETQDFERWLREKLVKYGLMVDESKIVDADPPTPDHAPDAGKLIEGAIVDSSIEKEK